MVLTNDQRKLVEDNINLARFMTYKWMGKGVHDLGYDEIFSLFSFALCKAGATFSPERGVKFSSYAITCMENEMKMAFRRSKPIKLAEINTFMIEDGDGNSVDIFEMIPNKDHLKYDEIVNLMFLREALKILAPRDIQILIWRYCNEETQAIIAKKLKITRAYVSRIETNIVKKIKAWDQENNKC